MGCRSGGFCVDHEKVMRVADEAAPEHDVVVLLVNEAVFRAASGGGLVAMTVNGEVYGPQETLQHELGHVLGHLADEYWNRDLCAVTPVCTEQRDCTEPNATAFSDRDRVKWKAWIEPGTPVPTPETDDFLGIVGVFKGNRYCDEGIYRPTVTGCLMQYPNPEFCPVCREAMVLAFWSRSALVDARSPAARDVVLSTCTRAPFALTTPAPLAWPLEVTWTVDGVELGRGSAFDLDGRAIGEGYHELEARVADTTPYVRNDPDAFARRTERWRLSVCGCSREGAPETCDHFPRPKAEPRRGCATSGGGAENVGWILASMAFAAAVRRIRRPREP